MIKPPTLGLRLAHRETKTSSLLKLHEVMFARSLGPEFARATDVELEEAFNAWNSNVIAAIPEDKLLVYNPKDGWGPLCKFLGLPVPATPFPHVNKRGDMVAVLQKQLNRGVFYDRLILTTLTLIVFAVMLFGYRFLALDQGACGGLTYFSIFLIFDLIFSILSAKALIKWWQ